MDKHRFLHHGERLVLPQTVSIPTCVGGLGVSCSQGLTGQGMCEVLPQHKLWAKSCMQAGMHGTGKAVNSTERWACLTGVIRLHRFKIQAHLHHGCSDAQCKWVQFMAPLRHCYLKSSNKKKLQKFPEMMHSPCMSTKQSNLPLRSTWDDSSCSVWVLAHWEAKTQMPLFRV